jgi:hypothetical protein
MSGRQDTPGYYMPYDSGEDTGTDDEDYDDSSLPESEDPRIRREEDPRYAIIRAAGPSFNTSEQQLKYMENAPGATYDNSTNITTLQNLVYLNPAKTTQTSLFSVKAVNRDRKKFPSPFNFEIKLPRVYKNVTKFQLVQLSFPNNTQSQIVSSSAFLFSLQELLISEGVPPECTSTCISIATGAGTQNNSMGIIEDGRVNSQGEPLFVTLSLPDGVYNNEQLATELTNQANNTPPLNLISFSTFREIFQTTHDVSALFNEPGDIYFSKLTNGQKHKYFTKQTIMNTYYTQQHIDSLLEITDKIAFNAYYYPVLKEFIATNGSRPFLSLGNYTFSQIYDSVMNRFEGLNSDNYFNICSTNVHQLNNFRRQLTFELRNTNKYTWIYDGEKHQYRVLHDSLHTSIQKDIQTNFETLLSHQLTLSNLTHKTLDTMKQKNKINAMILRDLENHLSTKICESFCVSDFNYLGGDNYSTQQSTFLATDLHTDEDFTNMFKFSSIFGNQYGTYHGTKLGFSNFLEFHSTISSYYNQVAYTKSTISSIYKTTFDQHHKYVSEKYRNLLPSHYISNRSYTTLTSVGSRLVGNSKVYYPGMTASNNELTECEAICTAALQKLVISWYSCLPVENVVNSLTYALGLVDLTLNIYSFSETVLSIPRTSNNYFLQINEAQSFNNMDVAMNENYDITNETTGQVKLMYAKILTGGIGSGEISQTVIQNPVVFETPLGKLDKLTFKIYYDDPSLTPGWLVLPFEVGFNDWDATFQIDEEIGFADRNTGWGFNPTVPIPDNPSALQYLALTSTNNPNNK